MGNRIALANGLPIKPRLKMPKLDPFQIASRLNEKLEDLHAGTEVAARDLKALLSNERLAAMEQAWTEQQALRKRKRARTKEEEAALGWKTKRQVQIEAVEDELAMHSDNALVDLKKEKADAEQRGAKIFMDAVSKGMREGKTLEQAFTMANNDLTRAGLQRIDGYVSRHLSSRDREIFEMEQTLMQKHESEMDEFEREQLELLCETERAERTRRTKR